MKGHLMTFPKTRQGFTMVELLVVIGMLLLLVGAVSSSVAAAHRRARIQQATTVAQEMTNAILAYENFGSMTGSGEFESPLAKHTMELAEATEAEMGFILGDESRSDGESGNIPVLFNANITAGAIRDPWGNPYRVTIRKKDLKIDPDSEKKKIVTAVSFPNLNRIPADQR